MGRLDRFYRESLKPKYSKLYFSLDILYLYVTVCHSIEIINVASHLKSRSNQSIHYLSRLIWIIEEKY